MSSIGEISLLFITKAHVLMESVVTRRMMLIYMASTAMSMILTPVILRLFVSCDDRKNMNLDRAGRRRKDMQCVMEMAEASNNRLPKNTEGVHAGESRRRKRDHTSDDRNYSLAV